MKSANKLELFLIFSIFISACSIETKSITNKIQTPVVNQSSNTGLTSDITELATIFGKVYNDKGLLVDFSLVKAKSLESSVPWVSKAQQTNNGEFIIRNVPVGINVEITVSKDGVFKSRIMLVKSNLIGDPNVNKLDFGHSLDNRTSDNNYFLNVEAKSNNKDSLPVDIAKPIFSPTSPSVWDGTYPPTNSPSPNSYCTNSNTPNPVLNIPIPSPCG